jgi:hypothetical protein
MFTITVASELYDAGRTEDGRPFHAERFYLVAEDTKGYRLRHFLTLHGAIRHEHPDGVFFEDVRVGVRAQLERLAGRVRAWLALEKKLQLDYWERIDPAYGSVAYVESGTEFDRYMEERMEGVF